MEFTDVIGFIVVALFLFFPAIKSWIEKQAKKKDPQGLNRDPKEDAFKEFMSSMGLEVPEEKPQPSMPALPPVFKKRGPKPLANEISREQASERIQKPLLANDEHFRSRLDTYSPITNHLPTNHPTKSRLITTVEESTAARISQRLRSLETKRDMVVMFEILSPPKALRSESMKEWS